jgi:hypothetical protein
MSFKKATKEQSKLRLALCGLAGTGKTFSALSIAKYLVPGGRVAVIDSERGSASLYADKFDFDVCELTTFSPLLYVETIRDAERAGYDVVVIDSLSHAWAGKDGALDQKDQAAERGGNSFTAWKNITPKQNALVDAITGSSCHVIATMRTKMEFVQDRDEKGKTEIKKVGLAVVQRDQIEYEFTLVGDIDHHHTLKISKTRVDGIDIGDQFERPGESLANRLLAWLNSGAAPRPREPQPAPEPTPIDAAFAAYLAAMEAAADQVALDKVATGPGRPAKGTPQHAQATGVYLARKAQLANGVAA